MSELWQQLAGRAGITLSEPMITLLGLYLDRLEAVNTEMNLTRIIDRADAELRHVGDALTLLRFLPPPAPLKPLTLADVGSGGGVPGIPIAITRPDLKVTLIESTQKKAAFLSDLVKTLKLPNVRVTNARAEQVQQRFDIVTARALAAMDKLVAWCLPLARSGGVLLAMKGPKIHEELPAAERAIRALSGNPAVLHNADLPGFSHVIAEIRRR